MGTYVVAPMPNAPGAPLPPLPQVPLPWLADVGRMFESDSVSSNSDELWKLIGVGFRTAYHRRKHARMTGFFDGLHLYAYFCAMNCAWALLCELSTYLVLFNAALSAVRGMEPAPRSSFDQEKETECMPRGRPSDRHSGCAA